MTKKASLTNIEKANQTRCLALIYTPSRKDLHFTDLRGTKYQILKRIHYLKFLPGIKLWKGEISKEIPSCRKKKWSLIIPILGVILSYLLII